VASCGNAANFAHSSAARTIPARRCHTACWAVVTTRHRGTCRDTGLPAACPAAARVLGSQRTPLDSLYAWAGGALPRTCLPPAGSIQRNPPDTKANLPAIAPLPPAYRLRTTNSSAQPPAHHHTTAWAVYRYLLVEGLPPAVLPAAWTRPGRVNTAPHLRWVRLDAAGPAVTVIPPPHHLLPCAATREPPTALLRTDYAAVTCPLPAWVHAHCCRHRLPRHHRMDGRPCLPTVVAACLLLPCACLPACCAAYARRRACLPRFTTERTHRTCPSCATMACPRHLCRHRALPPCTAGVVAAQHTTWHITAAATATTARPGTLPSDHLPPACLACWHAHCRACTYLPFCTCTPAPLPHFLMGRWRRVAGFAFFLPADMDRAGTPLPAIGSPPAALPACLPAAPACTCPLHLPRYTCHTCCCLPTCAACCGFFCTLLPLPTTEPLHCLTYRTPATVCTTRAPPGRTCRTRAPPPPANYRAFCHPPLRTHLTCLTTLPHTPTPHAGHLHLRTHCRTTR